MNLPLFPLNTVLFPDGILPLRIFEPRYLDMVSRCMREEILFVVCLIEEGREAGGKASFHTTGTTARIIDWDRGADGLLHLHCIGESRSRIVESMVQHDGLNLGEVLLLPEPKRQAVPERFMKLADLLTRFLGESGATHSIADPASDAGWVADRLAELLPFSLSQRQELLEALDPTTRLTLIADWFPGTG